MSIQIITDMNATSKICALSDSKHVELYVEGTVGDNFDTLAHLISGVITSTAKDFIEDETRKSGIEKKAKESGLTALDAAILLMKDKLERAVNANLAKEKIERNLGGMPDELKRAISAMLMKEIINALDEDKEDEDE